MNYPDRWFVVRSVGLSTFPKKSAKLQFHDPYGVLIIAIVIIVFFSRNPNSPSTVEDLFPSKIKLGLPSWNKFSLQNQEYLQLGRINRTGRLRNA